MTAPAVAKYPGSETLDVLYEFKRVVIITGHKELYGIIEAPRARWQLATLLSTV